MKQNDAVLRFNATVLAPASSAAKESWAFVVFPNAVSERFPRRGRTSVVGTINGCPFQATLEPDGNLSHWLKIDETLCQASGVKPGDTVTLEVAGVTAELEPRIPLDFQKALDGAPAARVIWEATTTIARIDWIHWIESAKQAKTREKRIASACDMLASGKKRVCCFDPSGFYSKALKAPKAAS